MARPHRSNTVLCPLGCQALRLRDSLLASPNGLLTTMASSSKMAEYYHCQLAMKSRQERALLQTPKQSKIYHPSLCLPHSYHLVCLQRYLFSFLTRSGLFTSRIHSSFTCYRSKSFLLVAQFVQEDFDTPVLLLTQQSRLVKDSARHVDASLRCSIRERILSECRAVCKRLCWRCIRRFRALGAHSVGKR